MKIINELKEYINDSTYKITIFNNSVNIINYKEITDFNDKSIKVKHNNGISTIIGDNLSIIKMENQELLIEGSLYEIILK